MTNLAQFFLIVIKTENKGVNRLELSLLDCLLMNGKIAK